MQLSDIAQVIQQMEGWMAEDARARLAAQMLTKISEATLRDQGGDHLEQWTVDGGPQTFLQWCAPTVPPRTVAHSEEGYSRDVVYGLIQQWRAGEVWTDAEDSNYIVNDRDRKLINSVLENLKTLMGEEDVKAAQADRAQEAEIERRANERFQWLAAQAKKEGWK